VCGQRIPTAAQDERAKKRRMRFAGDLNGRRDSVALSLSDSRRTEGPSSTFFPFERPALGVTVGNETTQQHTRHIESDFTVHYPLSGIAAEIGELQRAVRENPQNPDYAHKLSQTFVTHGMLEEMQDFWAMMMARYPRSELPAEQLLATLELKGDTNRIEEILPALCSIFPSSTIPKNQYLTLKNDSDERAEDFLFQHLREFPSESSLVELVADGTDLPSSGKQGICDKLFDITDWQYREGNQILANRMLDYCSRRPGDTRIWDLIFMWENLERKWANERSRNFAHAQQVWCHVELENWDQLRRLKPSSYLWNLGGKAFGKRLALKGQCALVVEQIGGSHVYRNQEFLRGALDGFKEKGDIDGLVRVAEKLKSSPRIMREALQAMLDIVNSKSQG
jgi:hypothetical protein